MAIEIGGTAAGQFGRITINGAAHSASLRAPAALAGTLNLSAADAFDPGLGSTFNVLTYTSHTGQFDAINPFDHSVSLRAAAPASALDSGPMPRAGPAGQEQYPSAAVPP